MTYTAKIEQTHAYKKRMHYMPNTDTFEEKDYDSLSYIRNVPFPSGWIKESGIPPCAHLDISRCRIRQRAMGKAYAVL